MATYGKKMVLAALQNQQQKKKQRFKSGICH